MFDAEGTTFGKSARDYMGSTWRTDCAWMRRTIYGQWMKATDMVIKFNPRGARDDGGWGSGRIQGGHCRDAGPAFTLPQEPYKFGRPTDIAFDKDGNIFIADGYTNSRVVKYDKWGKFIKAFGDKGKDPGQFNTPHSIQTDANGNYR